MTAYQGLFEHGNLQAHQRVMINGGSSSVGAVAIQLAKDHGATVITSCSGPKMEMVKGFGADEVRQVAAASGKVTDSSGRSSTTRRPRSANNSQSYLPSTSSSMPSALNPCTTPAHRSSSPKASMFQFRSTCTASACSVPPNSPFTR